MNQRCEILPGVHLRTAQSQKFKTECVSLNIIRPLCREEASLNALIPNVLFRGTAHYPDIRSFTKALDSLWGATMGTLVRKKGEIQTTGLYMDFIDETLAGEPIFQPMAQLLRELLLFPRKEGGGFLPEYFVGERQNLCNAIESVVNDKRAYATRQMLSVMCASEPYQVSRIGEEAPLLAATPEALYAHYRRILTEAPIEIFYMGARPARKVQEAVASLLQDLPRKPAQMPRILPFDGSVTEKYREMTMPLKQSTLSIGLRTGHMTDAKTLANYLLLAAIYGAGANSKLFRVVREEKSLCYYAGCSYDKYKDIMIVSSGIAAENYTAAKEEILHQLALCRQGSITQNELDIAKQQLLSVMRANLDSASQLDEFYLGQAILGVDYELEDLMDAIARTIRDDIVEAASTLKLDTVFFLKEDGNEEI